MNLTGDELRAAVRLSMQRAELDVYGLAPRVGYSPSALRQYLGGRYPGSLGALERALRRWLEVRTKRSSGGFVERLRKLVEEVGGPVAAARIAETRPAVVSDWLSSRTSPPFEAVARLALSARLSLDWLAFGRFGDLARRAS